MARILAYTSPGRSHLYPLTPILDELRRRGHQIVLRTLASHVELMRTRGFDAEPISAAIEQIELDDWRAMRLGSTFRAAAVARADNAADCARKHLHRIPE
jgi:UDP:flavonoid glycosyltransferase YjiC (YdhE family)